jgi:hypothetical protein
MLQLLLLLPLVQPMFAVACPKGGKGRTGARPDRQAARAIWYTARQEHPDKDTHRPYTQKGRTRNELLTIQTNLNRQRHYSS